MAGNIGGLVITHKDRLLRFGSELIFSLCEAKQVEVVILNQGEDTTFEEDLAKDVTNEHLQSIADKLNHRPRKSLNYLTPFEFLHSELSKPKTILDG